MCEVIVLTIVTDALVMGYAHLYFFERELIILLAFTFSNILLFARHRGIHTTKRDNICGFDMISLGICVDGQMILDSRNEF